MTPSTKPFHRAKYDRMLGGVCGGIANYIDWPAQNVRIVYVLASILSVAFPGALVYLVLWLFMPEEE
jgi:phage shock protein PspC (stress-responsive transcriptional regulator)